MTQILNNKSTNFFSCYIISETNLGLQCAQVLLEQGHQILGIISRHAETCRWARQNGIVFISTIKEFRELNLNKTFDYLFSIVNSQILPKSILQFPNVCAINYHDSLLPKYAGVNATSWAILNNEKIHGISWHKMEETIDTGSIFKQPTFYIKEDETALSLNLKCHIHALESFKKLIQELAGNKNVTILGKIQDKRNRSYFASHQKPTNLGIISWDDSAENIERQFRALYFGEYPNILTSFKIKIGDQFFIPNKLKILNISSRCTVGTVINITATEMQISTQTRDITLANFKNTKGQMVTIDQIRSFSCPRLKSGYKLKSLNKKITKELYKISNTISRSEDYWVNSLLNSNSSNMPFMNQTLKMEGIEKKLQSKSSKKKTDSNERTFLTIKNYNIDTENQIYSFCNVILAAFVIYFYRIGNNSDFTFGFVNSFLQNIPKSLKQFFPKYVPLTFSISSCMKIIQLIEAIQKNIVTAEKNKAYFNDLPVRNQDVFNAYTTLPIVVKIRSSLSNNKSEDDKCVGASLLLYIDEINQTYEIKTRNLLSSDSLNYGVEHILKNIPEHLNKIVEQILKNPNQIIEEIPLLPEKESEQVLVEWNDTEVSYEENGAKTIIQIFEQQVEKTPNNLAAIYNDTKLTYNELNNRANQLAHYLKSLGVGPDVLVAIMIDRSLDLIIGILGILKAGGAYVPLDPGYPNERLKFILDDTGVRVLVTRKDIVKTKEKFTKNALQAYYKGTVVVLDTKEMKEMLAIQSVSNPPSFVMPQNLVYVIYTSGSTGKPKGVMVTHGGLSYYMNHSKKTYSLYNGSSLLHSSIAFDMYIKSIFLPLIVGNSIYIISTNSIDALAKMLEEHECIGLLELTPAHLKILKDQIIRKSIPKQKCNLIVGGENLLVDDINLWLPILPEAFIFNEYGPTETTIGCCLFQLNNNNFSSSMSIPIGRPISNTQIYILDSNLNPVPILVPGEIYIGGVGLARGYLSRPDLTAEKFIPNPFFNKKNLDGTQTTASLAQSLRLYRTGDLGRFLPDGNIEFLGRIDDQVKIRGFRIELGEIESILSTYSDISQALVMAREDKPGYKQLVAYLVPEQKISASLSVADKFSSTAKGSFSILHGEAALSLIEDLRKHLSLSLPDYMVPAFFVFLDRMPLTLNGKIDKKSLPAPNLSLERIRDSYVAPTNEIEKTLISIWSEVLRIDADKISIHDNFFRLGGDSIISIQLTSKAQNTGIYFAVKDIFSFPTIAGLALIATKKVARENTNQLISLAKPFQGGVTSNIPLTPIQHWFFAQDLNNRNHYNQSSILLLSSSVDFSLLKKSFNFLIKHHDLLRCRYAKHKKNNGNNWEQIALGIDEENISSIWSEIDLKDVCDQDLTEAIEKQSSKIQASLNIESGPLLRAVLFNCGKTRTARLLIVIHHLVIDGVSWRILLEDLESIYKRLKEGLNFSDISKIYRKSHSYEQWSNALIKYAPQSSVLKKQIPYWKAIEQRCRRITLPKDFKEQKTESISSNNSLRSVVLSLNEEETKFLLQSVPKAYRTEINDILLTAVTLAIGDWTGKYEISLSLEGHGREDIGFDIDISRTIGWFTTVFPVYLDLKSSVRIQETKDITDINLEKAIKKVKEEIRKIPNKGIGYGVLAYLNKSLSKKNNVNAENQQPISFNYLGQWDNILQKEGLFSFAAESSRENISKENKDPYLLNINSEIKQGIFSISFGYNSLDYKKETIEKVGNYFISRLKQIINHCTIEGAYGYTSSDFSLINLSQQSINTNFASIKGIEDIYPLTPMQSGLLFQSLYTPDSDAYFVQSIFELMGVDKQVFQLSWQKVSDHHPILRTGIVWENLDEPVQYVLDRAKVVFEEYNLELEEISSKQLKLDEIIQKDRKKGFNLSKAPLFRIILVSFSENKHYMIWSQSHILTDGWSTPIILGDFLKTYREIKKGKRVNEISLTTRNPYREYIAWLKEQDNTKAEAFWKEYLGGISGPTKLSLKDTINLKEYSKEAIINDYFTHTMNLSEEITEKIQNFARNNNFTLNTVIQGTIATILKKYTQKEEIILGITVSGRTVPIEGIEDMVGLFINTLPLRLNFKENESIIYFLRRLQHNTQNINEYAYSSLAQIQSWSGLNDTKGGLFDVLLVFENYYIGEEAKRETSLDNNDNNLHVRFLKEIEKAEYPLNIKVIPGEKICMEFGYKITHFNEQTIQRLSSHFQELITELTNNSGKSINDLSLLTEQEKDQMLIKWNETDVVYREIAQHETIIQLFERQAQKTPNNVAIVYNERQLTYKQLNEKANQLAHYLRRLGIGPGVLVAIMVARSLDLIIGLLGIVKAGGAYVPLDPDYPNERLKFMLEDTRAKVLVTQEEIVRVKEEFVKKELQTYYKGTIVVLDTKEMKEMLSIQRVNNLPSIVMLHDLAYVIYTSGSTGRPKGAVIQHKSLINLIFWVNNTFDVGVKDRILFVTSICFDLSVYDIFGILIAGGSIQIASRDEIKDPDKLLQLLNRQPITFWDSAPAILNQLMNVINANNHLCKSNHLRLIFLSGDWIPINLLRHIKNYFSNAQIVSLGGATEATIWSNFYSVTTMNPAWASIPYGKPISNTQYYILDSNLNPVPILVPGEIYIGGLGLASGYLGRPDLTAEKFIPNPFFNKKNLDGGARKVNSVVQPLRLYRTGDLARFLPDGNIELLGRIDDQVKIRGFRVELGEIESILSAYSDISQALVIAREDKPGYKQLIAYLVPDQKISATLNVADTFISTSKEAFSVLQGEFALSIIEDLRKHLSLSLPDYMIPAFFVFLDKMPLTPNGKIDKKSLPAPDLSLERVGDSYVAPTNEIEKTLTSIWSEVLRIDANKISIHDNFFRLGGHSLFATQVASRMRNIFITEISLRLLFEYPTIAALGKEISKIIDSRMDKDYNSANEAIPLITTSSARPKRIPLSFAQNRLWFLNQLMPGIPLYNVPTVLKLVGSLNVACLERALNALIVRHEILRTVFPYIDEEACQLVLPELSIEIIEETINDKSSLVKLAKEESNIIFNLATGPLLKVRLVFFLDKNCEEKDQEKSEYFLFITMHHIITDGWSEAIFFKELATLYNHYLKEKNGKSCLEDFVLPNLSFQYADYTLWQRNWLKGKIFEDELSYWKTQLEVLPEFIQLPTDKIRPKELSYEGGIYNFTLPKNISEKIRTLSEKSGTTMFMTMLAIFQVFLYKISGQDDIVVGTPVAGRHFKELEGLIGFFVNTLAIRTRFEGTKGDLQTFINILEKVKNTILEGYRHQNIPFEQLVDHLNITRTLNRNPVFQIMFTYESKINIIIEQESFVLNNIKLMPFDSINAYSISQFDLSVHNYESDEGMNIKFVYSKDIWTEQAIQKLSSYFKELITTLAYNPEKNINDLSLLTEEEKEQMLVKWNNTGFYQKTNQYKTIIQLFEQQVEKTPNNIAVVYNDTHLTYKKLNEKANQLAYYLRNLGVGPDAPVAIMVDRSLDLITGLVGILKAGGTYVPLDPDYPNERLRYMLEDSRAKVLVTQGEMLRSKEKFVNKELETYYKGTIVVLDTNQVKELIAIQSVNNPPSFVMPQNLVYVIYTSGSTGKPKGVMVTHKGLTNLVKAQMKAFGIKEKSKVIQFASISFDAAASEIFTVIAKGATLYLLSKNTIKDKALFSNFLLKSKCNLSTFPPSFLSKMDPKEMRQMKTIITAGEMLTSHLAKEWIQNRCLINAYGPTETTVGCTSFEINSMTKYNNLDLVSIPIGWPISNTQIYILDSDLNPVPILVPGEIYIGGVGLARGYLGRPDLTAEKFIPNPFFNKKNLDGAQTTDNLIQSLRLYRTGDLARFLPNGNIEFLGRIDDQVKIRGFRIELGEIESILNAYSNISQALIIAREDKPGYKQLVAYLVADQKISASLSIADTFSSTSKESFSVLHGEAALSLIEDLRKHLFLSLPDYMVPVFFVFLDRMPLTPNGKIDKKSLPAPDLSLERLRDNYVDPSNEIEKTLVSIWSEVLKIDVDKISMHDNFFRLGGDSIISIQLASKAQNRGIYFAVKDIFSFPTVAGLALIAKKKVAKENTNKLISLAKPLQGEVTGNIPLIPIQYWFFEQCLNNINHYNQSSMLLLSSSVNFLLLKKSVNFLINHHDLLRCKYIKYKKNKDSIDNKINNTRKIPLNSWEQIALGIDEENISSIWSEVNLKDVNDKDLTDTIEKYSNKIQASLNIESGPLLRIVLFNCGENRRARLLIVIHHLVVDGISWRILLEGLESIYKFLKEGFNFSDISKTYRKSHSYKQWSNALLKYAQSSELKKQISYWKAIEQSCRGITLPKDFKEQKMKSISSNNPLGSVILSLNEEETKSLLQSVPKAYRTEINDILLTALTLAIGDWTGKYEISLSLEGHGREDIGFDIDISRTIGWFTTVFPVYLDLKSSVRIQETKNITDINLEKAIKTVKEEIRKIPNKGIGYGVLAYLNKNKNNVSADFQLPISFNYLGQWDNILQKEGLFTFAIEPSGENISKENKNPYFLNINSEVKQGIFSILFDYNSLDYKKETIEKVGNYFISRLKQIIKHCTIEGANEYTSLEFDLIVPFNYTTNSKKNQFIFFIHPIGGELHWYNTLAKKLSSTYASYGIKSPFLESDLVAISNMEELADNYTKQIYKVQNSGHYTIVGWSFGAIIAFEVAKNLILKGHIVSLIIIDQSSYLPKQNSNTISMKNKEIINIKSEENTTLVDYRKIKANLLNKDLLLRYILKGKVNNIYLFKSTELQEYCNINKLDPKYLGWNFYCDSIETFTIHGNHYSILLESSVNFIASTILNGFIE